MLNHCHYLNLLSADTFTVLKKILSIYAHKCVSADSHLFAAAHHGSEACRGLYFHFTQTMEKKKKKKSIAAIVTP